MQFMSAKQASSTGHKVEENTYQERVAVTSWVQLHVSFVATAIQTYLCVDSVQGHGAESQLPIPVWQWHYTEGVTHPAG